MKNYTIYTTNHMGERCKLSECYTEDNMRYILVNDKTGVVHCSDEYETIPLVMEMYDEDGEPYTLYRRSKVTAKIAGDVYGDLTEKALYVKDDLYYTLYTTFGFSCEPRYTVKREGGWSIREVVTFDLNGEWFEVNVSGDSVPAMAEDCIAAVKARKKERELGMYTGGLYAMISTCEGIQEALEADPEGLFDDETRDSAYDALTDVIDALTDITTVLEDGYRG